MPDNPLLTESTLPCKLPDFTRITPEHYREAVQVGIAEHAAEVEQIAADPAAPTAQNTVVALERTGRTLHRATAVLYNHISAFGDDAVRDLGRELGPVLSGHHDSITLDPRLHRRISAVLEDLASDPEDLDPETRHLVQRWHLDLEVAGAGLDEQAKDRLRAINARLSELDSEFASRLLADTLDSAVHVTTIEELAGLDETAVAGAAEAAAARGLDGWLLTCSNFTQNPLLAALDHRPTRERLMAAQQGRGRRGNEHDTSELVLETVRLRAERAELLGFANHAELIASIGTAGTPQAIADRLVPMVAPARAMAEAELEALTALAGHEIGVADHAYWTEKLRAERHDLDLDALRPYFEAERVLIDGVFHAASELFGLEFVPRTDLVGYLPEVRVFEVQEADGSTIGLYLLDLHTRDTKNGGAWMNALVSQSGLLAERPVVCNNLNVPRPAPGRPTLLSLANVTTLFHEFGHALHGLLSDVTYPKFSGTRVPRDFVEFPSQVNEMWIRWPEVVGHYARHHETGEPVPTEVLDRLAASGTFNQGFETCESLAAALLDQEWHLLSAAEAAEVTSVAEFEKAALSRIGLDDPRLPPRYHSTAFAHVFSGGYSAGYYSYLWAEVFDADTVAWFEANGGLTRANGDHFRATLLSRGHAEEALDTYRGFRGQDADPRLLLARRGLL